MESVNGFTEEYGYRIICMWESMVKTAVAGPGCIESRRISAVALINARFVKPLDEDALLDTLQSTIKLIVTMEENVMQRWIWRACD